MLVALQKWVQSKYHALIHHFGSSKLCWKLNGTITTWQLANWSAKRTSEFLKIAPQLVAGEGTGAICRLSACCVLCYLRRGNNDKYHLWWLLMWPGLCSHQVNYCKDTICENIWWDKGSWWPFSRALRMNWKSVLLLNHIPLIDSFLTLHFKTGGKTVRFLQEASKNQSQSLLICRNSVYTKRKAILCSEVIYKGMTQLDNNGRICPQEFLMYKSKNKCNPRSKRLLLDRLDSFGPEIRCLLYLL